MMYKCQTRGTEFIEGDPQVLVSQNELLEWMSLESSLGKTLLARTLAKVLDVPFSVSDATSFTQVRLFIVVSP